MNIHSQIGLIPQEATATLDQDTTGAARTRSVECLGHEPRSQVPTQGRADGNQEQA